MAGWEGGAAPVRHPATTRLALLRVRCGARGSRDRGWCRAVSGWGDAGGGERCGGSGDRCRRADRGAMASRGSASRAPAPACASTRAPVRAATGSREGAPARDRHDHHRRRAHSCWRIDDWFRCPGSGCFYGVFRPLFGRHVSPGAERRGGTVRRRGCHDRRRDRAYRRRDQPASEVAQLEEAADRRADGDADGARDLECRGRAARLTALHGRAGLFVYGLQARWSAARSSWAISVMIARRCSARPWPVGSMLRLPRASRRRARRSRRGAWAQPGAPRRRLRPL